MWNVYFIHPHTQFREVEGRGRGQVARTKEQGKALDVNVVKVEVCLNENLIMKAFAFHNE